MSAVTILLAVLTVAINGFSWIILERQSSSFYIFLQAAGRIFLPAISCVKAFCSACGYGYAEISPVFTVRTDAEGNVLDVNLEQISAVSREDAIQYAGAGGGQEGKD